MSDMEWFQDESVQIYRGFDLGYFPDPAYCVWIAHVGKRLIAFKEQLYYKQVAPDIAKDMVEQSRGMRIAMTYCLPLDAPVWMGDFTFKPLSEVKVGDSVISGEKKGSVKRKKGSSHKRLQRATVTAVHRTRQEVIKLTMRSGRILYCTPDHRWLSATIRYGDTYVLPKVGGKLVHVVDIPEPCKDPITAAWLGGIYDGEGCRELIAQHYDHNPEVYDEIEKRLNSLGFATSRDANGVRWKGGMQACTNFVNWIPSIRYKQRYADRAILIANYKKHDEIIAIESCGMQDVGCLTTTTGNFIAYGYQTSNCDPVMDIKTAADVRTIREIFEEHGVPMEASVNNREHYAHAVHTALQEEAEPGVPRLQILDRVPGPGNLGCPYLIKTIPQMRFDPKHPLRMADSKNDHGVIALAYFLISSGAMERKSVNTVNSLPKWMRPKEERKKDKFLGYGY